MIDEEQHYEDKKIPTIQSYDGGEFIMNVPQCCREGWDTCTHVAKPIKAKRRNIGL